MTYVQFDKCFDTHQRSTERLQLIVIQLQVFDSSHWFAYNLQKNKYYYIIIFLNCTANIPHSHMLTVLQVGTYLYYIILPQSGHWVWKSYCVTNRPTWVPSIPWFQPTRIRQFYCTTNWSQIVEWVAIAICSSVWCSCCSVLTLRSSMLLRIHQTPTANIKK